MLSPLPNSHRRNARKLGRGQYARLPGITVRISNVGATATIEFARPVFITGTIPLAVPGRTLVNQVILTPTTATQLFNASLNNDSYSLPSDPENVASSTGAPIFGLSGLFAITMPITANDVLIADGAGGSIGGRGSIAASGTVSLASNNFRIGTDGALSISTNVAIGATGSAVFGNHIFNYNGSVLNQPFFFLGAIINAPLSQSGSTVAALPAGNDHDTYFANDGLKIGEGPGTGTGVPVYFSSGQWRVYSTDQPVQA